VTPHEAAAAARDAARSLADVASRVLPATSRGRRRIVAAADDAASRWSTIASSTPTSGTVGDDRARAVRAARDASSAAASAARRVAREVSRMSDDALRRAWNVATAPSRAARTAVADALRAAADRAERVATAAATTAARTWGGAVTTIGLGGLVMIAALAWILARK
jgi:hypothetical protein